MDDKEKLQYARDWRDICFQKGMMTEQRGSELEDQFIKLQVQIAAILFAFSGIFIDKFATIASRFPGLSGQLIKLIFTLAVFMLVTSLGMGLLHLRRVGKFWEGFLEMRDARLQKWNAAVKGEITTEEAQAFHWGASNGKTGIATSPNWPWIMQSTTLGIAVFLFFVVFLIFLFP